MADRKDTHVAERIRTARAEAGLTQQQLADKMETSLRGVQMWEQAARTPRMDGLAGLALALGKPVAYFFKPLPAETKDRAA